MSHFDEHLDASEDRVNATILIAGGLAAHRCAAGLRRYGHAGRITMVCGEPVSPYDRPPLSKEILSGQVDPAASILRSPEWYEEQRIELVLGASASALHRPTTNWRSPTVPSWATTVC